MASVISTVSQAITSSEDGSLVEITLSNSGTTAVGPLVATAVYAGASQQYVWTQSIATLAAAGGTGDSTKFNLSIDGEATYDPTKMHLGLAFVHTTP